MQTESKYHLIFCAVMIKTPAQVEGDASALVRRGESANVGQFGSGQCIMSSSKLVERTSSFRPPLVPSCLERFLQSAHTLSLAPAADQNLDQRHPLIHSYLKKAAAISRRCPRNLGYVISFSEDEGRGKTRTFLRLVLSLLPKIETTATAVLDPSNFDAKWTNSL